jgi:iron-sulfur cluster assembly protein
MSQECEDTMIELTPAAHKAIKRFISDAGTPLAGLRVYVEGGGCSGFRYGLLLEQNKSDDDFEYDLDGIALLLDPVSRTMIEGLSVDFVDSLIQTGFKFSNPNHSGGCSCGESFSV